MNKHKERTWAAGRKTIWEKSIGTITGSIIEINGQWYVFYHRLTHKSDYSRQSCAEKITILPDGSIPQVEMTSCGLNPGPLKAEGTYPATIACNITNGKMPYGSNSIYTEAFPNVNHFGDERFIAEVESGTLIGYKYFELPGEFALEVTVRKETEANKPVYEGPTRVDIRCADTGEERVNYLVNRAGNAESSENYLEVRVSETGDAKAVIKLTDLGENWEKYETKVTVTAGVSPLYLVYSGKEKIQIREINFR